MPRAPRIEYPGAVYHVMSRGVKGEAIFLDNLDYDLFVQTFGEACKRTGWLVHAFVGMRNHYHALVETPEANLVGGMKWFQGAYAQRFNRRHDQRGQVFGGRYKALVIDPDQGGHFERVSTYIHLNPARAKLVGSKGTVLGDYRWSSYIYYLATKRKRPVWLEVQRVLGNLSLRDTPAGRREYERYLQGRVQQLRTKAGREELERAWKPIRRGWYLGQSAFGEGLMERIAEAMEDHKRESYSGEAVQQHDREQAGRLIRKGMKALGMRETDLPRLKKGELRKCALAWLAHSNSTISHA